MRALLIEDNDFQRNVARKTLERVGIIQISEASNGADALAQLTASPNAIDIVFLDLHLPGVDGIAFLRQLGEVRKDLAVVIVSGLEPALLTTVDMMAKAHQINLMGIIEKPITTQKLSNILSRPRTASARDSSAPSRFTAAEVAQAFASGQMTLHFQPIVHVKTQHVAGAEALTRWQHPIHGLIPAAEFMDLIEAAQCGHALGKLAVETGLDFLQSWQKAGLNIKLSINLSLAFLESTDAVSILVDAARARKIGHQHVVIEVTEGIAATDLVPMLENLARLRMLGFALSIDDYGTGYATVQQLARIPFTQLKIDKSFVQAATSRQNMRIILESCVDLARRLELDAVAEGVEREEEWALLRALGCDYAQGYFLARPMSGADLVEWVQGWEGSLTRT
jgi:EAL domain-containing protein (putative c-di-GMP-specific phosphodiesterase class I)/ActR/RegA family two-component response regulator